MPHGPIPSTNVEVVESYDDVYLPISTGFNAGDVVQFQVAQTGMYTDLSKSYVLCTGNWQTFGGSVFAVVNSGLSPGFPNTGLFGRQELYYNGGKISPSRDGDQYIQFLHKLLLRKEAGFESDVRGVYASQQLPDQDVSIDCLDDPGSIFATLPAAGTAGGYAPTPYTSGDNIGALMRRDRVLFDIVQSGTAAGTETASNAVQYMYRPEIGGWSDLKKYLPDRVAIDLQLTVNAPTAYGYAQTEAQLFQFVFSKIELILHHVKLRKEVVDQNNLAMLEKPWEHPITVNIYKRQTVNPAAGATSVAVDLSSVYQGAQPKALCVFAQNSTFQSSFEEDIFWFDEGTEQNYGGFTNLFILVNGRQIPRRPYEMQGLNKTSKFRQYRDFIQGSAAGWSDKKTNMLSFLQYCMNHPVYLFWIDPLEELHDQYTPTQDVNIEVHGVIQSNLGFASNISVHVIALVPAVLEIDGSRAVKVVSRSRELLSLE